MPKYSLRLERKSSSCDNGSCGHPHRITFEVKPKHIVCSELSCSEIDTSIIRHILVPYDGSEYSNRAFEFALDLAKNFESRITVCTSIYHSDIGDMFEDSLEPGKIIEQEKLEIIKKSFSKMNVLAKKFGIQINTETFTASSVQDSIISYATTHKVDFIVMGTRGRGANQFLLGSVSVAISQKAPCPVLLIK